jgi:toxin-antitoxin system PIN domain toxin
VSTTVDANVLVYASNRADPVHEPARSLVERLARGPELVYLFWPALMGYLRIVTHPGILPEPMSPADAAANVSTLLALPHVRAPGEADGFWDVFQVVAGGGLRGNATPDGHLVALMRQHGVRRIYSRDRDFRRFDGVQAVDPFAVG